uniref:tRNA N(3)-methylcytidine methyltransferase n=1 Tax=Aceria tosichella TaxID=561515 RepID=A0A6G1SCQ8_9ACAR
MDSHQPPQPSTFKRDRKLLDANEVFTHNAWDDTEWTDDMYEEAERRIEEQRQASRFYGNDIGEQESNVTNKWNEFYALHEDKFFKDRKWVFSEFPELLQGITMGSLQDHTTTEPYQIFEVGCGVGNAVVHILNNNTQPNLRIYCCDLSEVAIETLKKRDFYLQQPDSVIAFQADVCREFESNVLTRIEPNSQNFIMLIFTLSAFKPELMRQAIRNLTTLLRPGGMILFRDYAQYDLTQLRFKGSALLRDNYYIRSDGTTSYYFTKETVRELFTGDDSPLVEVELKLDNRLLVNRLKGIKMCRCWIQGKFKKLT